MSWLYRHIVRPALFLQESEPAHNRTLAALAFASRFRPAVALAGGMLRPADLPVRCLGLTFPNPVGLAAGMDKQGVAVPMWEAMGFGFSELGGVTWHAQPGNPPPRMFRVIPEEALINRMGFNNGGADALARRLQDWRDRGAWPGHPVGINLGKSKVTPLDKAPEDYAASFERLRDLADFFVVNVSSPNTPNLRQLQDRAALDEILAALQERNPPRSGHPGKPILVKVAPDLTFDALDEIVEVALQRTLSGIVATNTTITRPGTSNPAVARVHAETGGLSGRPLRSRSTEIIRHLFRQTHGRLPLIGVGGIASAADAWEKVTAGASLIQVYSALVFEGPGLAHDLVEGLRERLAGARWEDAIGSAA
ncbi:MAG: quinone-dependent dihydroorotate dehydrogenase [Verrucomicrobiales bacterium]|nr:quinone-dependent dihydroorotate dehydrogenase [Verrucomicrobiales bacterium]